MGHLSESVCQQGHLEDTAGICESAASEQFSKLKNTPGITKVK